MTGFKSKRQAAQDKMELADAYASAVAATPNMPTPLERKLSVARIERARNALEAALEQQAEPPPEWLLIILDEYGLDAIAFVAEWKAAQQQAEPVPRWDVDEDNPDSLSKHPAFRATPKQQAEPVAVYQWRKQGCADWYDGHPDYCDGGGPYETRILYTTPPQRKELSAREILNMMPSGIPAEYDGELMEFARAVEAKLKEVV